MSLPPGTLLGPYELLAPIGAGGMGEVYRARDPRLERDVAIKVLQPAFAADPDQLRRFEQEARSVALLNHPNILQVYDTGMVDGAPYIVMELLSGRNLRELLDGPPLGVRRALAIAVQVARGLAVAHEKKIIHRDLKPENIFVDPDGLVKILDFGLAKLLAHPSGDPDETREWRASQAFTQAGTLMGTAGYMSPEQVNGWSVDHRSDLFSFGIILFELVTGTPPFRRPSMAETMHAILKEDPPALGSGLPPVLERTLLRCLEKDPRRRFQSATDLVFALEGASLPQSAILLRPRLRPLPPWALRTALAAGVLALAALAFAAGRRGTAAEPVVYHRLTYRRGVMEGARFSPDGQTFVFGLANDGQPAQLMVGRTDGVGARPLGLPPGTRILSISATGEMALLFRKQGAAEGTLALAPLSGGAPRELLENVFAADWGPDGQSMAVVRAGPKGQFVLDYPIGHRLYDGPPVTPYILDCPRVSPRGDRVAFLEHLGIGRESLSVVDLEGHRTVLVEGGCDSLQWSPDGRRIFFTYRHPDDRRDLRSVTLGGRQRILDTVLGRMNVQDISRTGRLLVDQSVDKTTLLFRGPGDRVDRDLSWLHTSILADLSPDGSRVLIGETLEGSGPGGAYLRRTDGADAVRLGDGDPLSLSRDGRWATVLSNDAGKTLALLPAGPGAPRPLARDIRADWAVFVDGDRQVLMGGTGPDGVFRGYTQDVAGGPARPWPGALAPEAFCVVAPDGAKVALGPLKGHLVISSLDGRRLQDLGGLGEADVPIQWHASGDSIFLADLSALPARIVRLDLATGRRTPWTDAGPSDRSGVGQLKGVAITPDGRSLAYSFVRVLTSDLYVTDPVN
ncbi:serine/threonine-protein kinase [Geothrix sp. 21YS21S-2]|uniref:serine/threonine-protein kinase n=1 Tax=Geothrix sp. 21YS21S-2 TaxID=3068893 RepID=UPI0027B88CB4|nr:serine/threonine-protein kinase [Geothrix sp. 21YS21S-2]